MVDFLFPDFIAIAFGAILLGIVLYSLWATQNKLQHRVYQLEFELAKERVKRRRIVTSYRMNRMFFGSMFDKSPIPIYIKNTDGYYTKVNQAFVDLVGQDRTSVIGANVFGLAPTELAQHYSDMDERLFQGEELRQSYMSHIQFHSGELHDVIFHKTALRTRRGNVRGLLGMVFEIDPFKKVERDLEKSLDECRTLFEQSLVGIVFLKGGRFIEAINPYGAELLGYVPEELIGQSVSVLHVSPKHFLAFGEEHVARLQYENIIDIEYPFRRRDNLVVWCSISGKAVCAADISQGILWTFHDVSRHKQRSDKQQKRGRALLNDIHNHIQVAFCDIMKLPEYESAPMQHTLHVGSLAFILAGCFMGNGVLKKEPVEIVLLLQRIVTSLKDFADRYHVELLFDHDAHLLTDDNIIFVSGEKALLYSMLMNMIESALLTSKTGETVSVSVSKDDEIYIDVALHNARLQPWDDVFLHGEISCDRDDVDVALYSARLLVQAHGGCVEKISTGDDTTIMRVRLPRTGSA